MLNPSTADALIYDPTVKKCCVFARRLGFTACDAVNMYAYRSTDPAALWKVADPVGPEKRLPYPERRVRVEHDDRCVREAREARSRPPGRQADRQPAALLPPHKQGRQRRASALHSVRNRTAALEPRSLMRIRTIKPEFWKSEHLADLPPFARLLFIGLWNCADREGRLEDRPKRLKAELFPYDDVDVDALLSVLAKWGFIVRDAKPSDEALMKFARAALAIFVEIRGERPIWAHRIARRKWMEDALDFVVGLAQLEVQFGRVSATRD
jgi:hypothetical protein